MALSILAQPFVPCLIRDYEVIAASSMEVWRMKFLLTLYGEERGPEEFSPEAASKEMAAWQAFDEAAREAGVLLACEGLAPSQAATTIRVSGGERRMTDGPFIETKEQLGGFVFLEARDLDEALEWSERLPWNNDGCFTEIRPIMDYEAWNAQAEPSSTTSASTSGAPSPR